MTTFDAADVDGLMREALDKVTGQIRTADRVVFLLQEGRQLSIKAAHGGRPGRELPVEKVSRAILRRVRRTGRTLFLSDAMNDNGLGPRRSIQEIGQRSVICAPLKANGRVVGLLYADTVSMIAAFTPAHLQWVNRMTESLNQQLAPLIPEYMETMLEDTMVPGDDPDSELVLPLQARPVNPPAPSRPFGIGVAAELALAPDRAPLDFKNGKVDRAKERAAEQARTRRQHPVKLLELATFYRGLSSMLAAGITIHRALDVLGEQDSSTAQVARILHQDVVNGHRLSVAMARFPHVFNVVQRSLIRVGEETGCLDILSQSLSEHVENRIQLKGKMVTALTYPVMVGIFCFLACLFAPPLFLNDFFATLRDGNIPMPALTQLVIAVSAALWNPLFWIVVIGSGLGVRQAYRKAMAHPKWSRWLEQKALDLPVVGPVRQSFFLLDFMQTLALQLEAGMRLDKSLLLSAKVSGNSYLKEMTDWVVEEVKAGSTLSYALQRSKVFPRTVVEFVLLGEETGKMSDCLRFSEALLRERAESALEAAEALMEPLAVCLVGILVGIVALACMLPLVRMFEAFI